MPEPDEYGHNATSDRHARELAGREVYFDWEGFFWEPGDWTEEIALILCREAGLGALLDVHWKVLRFFREFYYYHGRAPLNRELRQGTGMSLGALEGLFPGGIRMGARRLAGLPNPKTCG